MKVAFKSVALPFILVTLVSFVTCSDSRTGLDQELLARNLARVHINLDLPGDVEKISFIDRVLRFFATEAVAQEAPSIESILVQVTGPGMAPVTATITGSASTIYVPAGVSRFFDVRASTDMATLRGTTIATLQAGSTANLVLSMSFYESKIVIPDLGDRFGNYPTSSHPRIVSITDISGAGWLERDWSYYSFAQNDFRIWDIDFDNRGRLIVANELTPYAILRMDSLSSSTYEVLIPDIDTYGVHALAYDHRNNILYIGHDNWEIWKYEDSSLNFFAGSIADIRGLAVDTQGNVYAAYDNDVIKYDSGGNSQASYGFSGGSQAWDIMVKDSFVYVARYSSTQSERMIVEFDTDLNPTGRELTGRPGGGDDFFGPHRFVAIYSRRFFVIDETEGNGTNADERIVAFDNISGSGWQTFKPSDIGETEFSFYDAC